MDIALVDNRPESLVDELVAIWRASVEATHDFLTPDDIERIAAYVPSAIAAIASLVIARDDGGVPLGFAGVDEGKLEMLFIGPDHRGTGVGKALLGFAVDELGVKKVDVNEENGQARGFYEHEGFVVVGRSETDEQGEPFPILHMELPESDA